jgi:hypothetical protein
LAKFDYILQINEHGVLWSAAQGIDCGFRWVQYSDTPAFQYCHMAKLALQIPSALARKTRHSTQAKSCG